jgi:hypothetical protein
MRKQLRDWEFWAAIAAVVFALLGSASILYARFYNVEWRLSCVERKLDQVMDHFSILSSRVRADGEVTDGRVELHD